MEETARERGRPPRARDLGVPFEGEPGPYDAITDVPGVEVGHCTRIEGRFDAPEDGPVVRTGITVVHPLGRDAAHGVSAGRFVLNGYGEMTGAAHLDAMGALFGPVASTNTLSAGVVRDALIAWARDRGFDDLALRARTKPVVLETWDGRLNDVYGQHLRARDARRALDDAAGGPVAEGNVGGGTGMVAFEFKAGIGTASRRVADLGDEARRATVGVLVQANFGRRPQLRIAGVPVGRALHEPRPTPPARGHGADGDGSIATVVATDAPLLPFQLRAVARRAALALGRLGSIVSHGSGDFFLAFSTGNRVPFGDPTPRTLTAWPTEALDPLYEATVEAAEEAVVNALVAAEPMTGAGGAHYPALPHGALREVLRRYHQEGR